MTNSAYDTHKLVDWKGVEMIPIRWLCTALGGLSFEGSGFHQARTDVINEKGAKTMQDVIIIMKNMCT